MADSILPNSFAPSFLRFLVLLVLLALVNKSLGHKPADIFYKVAEGTATHIDPAQDFVLCRQCGADLAESGFILNQLSPEAVVKVNQTLFGKEGVEVQVLTNPLGIQFQVITLSTANCVGVSDSWHADYSWFPGYAWKLCVCSYCGGHLGWMFEPLKTATIDNDFPTHEGFYALILDKILSETFANSLIVIPKSYKN